MKNIFSVFCTAMLLLFVVSCSPKFTMFPDYNDPLKETTLSGTAKDEKILVIPISGIISDRPSRGLLVTRPSVVQEVVAALKIAEHDPQIKAVILRIDTPGGSVTGSDILYNELKSFKERTHIPIITLMMDLATSGGYYCAMASDFIIAHPTSITGSIGVIMYTVNITGLFDKVGVKTYVIKSGEYKDSGSPFKALSEKEQALFQTVINEMYSGFISAIAAGRSELNEQQVRLIADGRIYTAKQALQLKLIDQIGYVQDAIKKAQEIAKLSDQARVVIYRRHSPTNDNIYNPSTSGKPGSDKPLVDLGFNRHNMILNTGFYYIWQPGLYKPGQNTNLHYS